MNTVGDHMHHMWPVRVTTPTWTTCQHCGWPHGVSVNTVGDNIHDHMWLWWDGMWFFTVSVSDASRKPLLNERRVSSFCSLSQQVTAFLWSVLHHYYIGQNAQPLPRTNQPSVSCATIGICLSYSSKGDTSLLGNSVSLCWQGWERY